MQTRKKGLTASPWPRRDFDDAVLAIREGSGSRSGFAAERPLLCALANRLPDGQVWTRPSCPSRRCRLWGSVGAALPWSVATQSLRCQGPSLVAYLIAV